jgi:hypothetical protein
MPHLMSTIVPGGCGSATSMVTLLVGITDTGCAALESADGGGGVQYLHVK